MSTAIATSEMPAIVPQARAAPRRVTADELLALPNEKDFELVDGRLVERFGGARSSSLAIKVACLILEWSKSRAAGYVFECSCGYQCFSKSPDNVRKPKVSFIRFGRLPGEVVPEGYITIAPDLAIEVLSPNDLASNVDSKVEEYLQAGVRLVWVVQPDSKTVLIYRANGTIAGLREADELSGEDVLPGFRCRVHEIFRQFAAETKVV